jgi:hypothetical protein
MSRRSSLPHKAVRFYGNTDFALDAIAHRQVTLVHVSKLNDPFDPYFFFETDFDADYDQLCAFVRRRSQTEIEWFARHVSREQWAQSVAETRAHMERQRHTTFVLSCSAANQGMYPNHNLYMWGHYGNGHRGVAIEFDTVKTASLLVDQHSRENKMLRPEDSAWIQIEYKADISPFTAKMFYDFYRSDYEGREVRTSLHTYLDTTIRAKSIVWRQEHEWRMLWRNDKTSLKIHRAPIPPDAITAVYIGLSASPSVMEDIIFETQPNFPAAKIFKARKEVGFSLQFEQV